MMILPSDSAISSLFLLGIVILGITAASAQVGVPPRESVPGRSGECTPVDRPQAEDVQVEDVVGNFNFEMYVTQGVRRDSVVQGKLIVKRWSPGTSGLKSASIDYAVWGWTTIPIERLGGMPLIVTPSSTDPEQPGILGLRSRRDSAITLHVGSRRPDGSAPFDVGMVVKVLSADQYGFRGTWGSSTRARPVPSGHFCAWRTNEND